MNEQWLNSEHTLCNIYIYIYDGFVYVLNIASIFIDYSNINITLVVHLKGVVGPVTMHQIFSDCRNWFQTEKPRQSRTVRTKRLAALSTSFSLSVESQGHIFGVISFTLLFQYRQNHPFWPVLATLLFLFSLPDVRNAFALFIHEWTKIGCFFLPSSSLLFPSISTLLPPITPSLCHRSCRPFWRKMWRIPYIR